MRAMGLVYTTMLAFVPLLALSFSVLKGFGYHERMAPLLQSFLEPLGPRSEEITATVIGFVDNVQESTLAGVSLALLLVTAFSMARRVEFSFNFIWQVDHPRSFARRFSDYLSVMLLGPMLMTVAMGMLASIEKAAIVDRLDDVETFGRLLAGLSNLTPYVVVIVAFSFLYAVVPNTPVRIRTALLGGVLAGSVWAGCGEFFATFVAGTNRTTIIYSSFAIVILGMLWLYLSWLILLLGAQFAFLHQNPEYLRLETRIPGVSNGVTERLALSVMLLTGQERDAALDGWSIQELTARIGVPGFLLKPVVDALLQAHLLAETADERLVSGRDLRKISVADILTSVRKSPTHALDVEPERWNPTVEAVAGQIDAALRDATRTRSLAELVDEDATRSESESR